VLAQDPKPRMRRVISNLEIEQTNDMEATAASNFVLVQARGSNQYTWCGRSIHRLRREDGAIKIVHKKVLLVNSEQEMPVLQFLI
jgi:3-phenylpropionate/cinnamic acid dioxygenase small subunit